MHPSVALSSEGTEIHLAMGNEWRDFRPMSFHARHGAVPGQRLCIREDLHQDQPRQIGPGLDLRLKQIEAFAARFLGECLRRMGAHEGHQCRMSARGEMQFDDQRNF